MTQSPHHKPIHPATAERHEAVTLRLDSLLRQVEAVALRQGQKGVPADVERRAADLLFEANPFLPRRLGAPLPATAPTYAGLAVELAAARAALEAFELRHTAWDPALKCRVWRSTDGALPVGRLKPEPAIVVKTEADEPVTADMRRKIARQIRFKYEATYQHGYAAGYAAATAGEPPDPDPPLPDADADWIAGFTGTLERAGTGRPA